MINKILIMCQLSCFQKKATILIVFTFMLLISNLDVCSSLGSYQVYSQAISANINCKKKSLVFFLTTPSPLIYQVYDYEDTECLLLQNISKTVDAVNDFYNNLISNNSTSGTHTLSFKTKNYAKYDFSGFDN